MEEKEQLMENRDRHESAMEELKRVREEGEMQTEELVGKLEDKSKAGKRVQRSLSHFSCHSLLILIPYTCHTHCILLACVWSPTASVVNFIM